MLSFWSNLCVPKTNWHLTRKQKKKEDPKADNGKHRANDLSYVIGGEHGGDLGPFCRTFGSGHLIEFPIWGDVCRDRCLAGAPQAHSALSPVCELWTF